MASTPLTVEAVRSRGVTWLHQLRIAARRPGDLIFRSVTYTFVAVVLLTVVGIAWVLIANSWTTITAFGTSFLSNEAFDPVHNSFGVRPRPACVPCGHDRSDPQRGHRVVGAAGNGALAPTHRPTVAPAAPWLPALLPRNAPRFWPLGRRTIINRHDPADYYRHFA